METLQTKLSQKRRLNYLMLSPSIFQMGLNSLIKEHHKLQEALEVTCRSRGFTIEELSKHVSDMLPLRTFFGYLIIPYYYKGTLRYYNARNVIGQAQDTIIQIKILQDLERIYYLQSRCPRHV